MKNLFVSLELAKKLKPLGFNDPCLLGYDRVGMLCTMTNEVFNWSDYNTSENYCSAPLYQQVIEWFLRHDIFIISKIEVMGSAEYEFTYEISYIPREFRELKRPMSSMERVESYQEGIGTYMGAWHKREECLEEAIKHAITLI